MTVLAAHPPALRPTRDLLARIVTAGLAGGAVDFVYASSVGAMAGRSFVRVWQGVAGGWLGKAALDGGVASFVLGVLTHFGIATAMAAAYVLLARRIPIVVQRPLATAPVYGLILYGVMYHLVLPMRWPEVFPRWKGPESMLDVLAHVGVALAIAWVASRPAKAR
jgi:hypothetical protein